MIKNINNIVVGLLKNMLQKNKGFAKEGFKKFDDDFFKVVLDASGFDKEEVKGAMTELCNADTSGDIMGSTYNDTTKHISFYIRNEVLIALRNEKLHKNSET